MKAVLKSKWMMAVKLSDTPAVWTIEKKSSKELEILGSVEFCKKWKEFVFLPSDYTQYATGCLADLAAFLAELNKEQGGA